MKRKTVKIPFSWDTKSVSNFHKVKCYYCGDWCIHKSFYLNENNVQIYYTPVRYVITHIPSGLALRTVFPEDLEKGKGAVVELSKMELSFQIPPLEVIVDKGNGLLSKEQCEELFEKTTEILNRIGV